MFDSRQTKDEIIEGGMRLHAQLVEALAEVERLRAVLLKIQTEQFRIATATDMTRPAMREAAMRTHDEIDELLLTLRRVEA